MIGIQENVELSNQFIFDYIVKHFKKQRIASVDCDGACSYRWQSQACAVGCLITDKEYKSNMEGRDVYWLISNSLLPERFVPYSILLRELQEIHDGCHDIITRELLIPSVARALKNVALQHGLDAKEVDWA